VVEIDIGLWFTWWFSVIVVIERRALAGSASHFLSKIDDK